MSHLQNDINTYTVEEAEKMIKEIVNLSFNMYMPNAENFLKDALVEKYFRVWEKDKKIVSQAIVDETVYNYHCSIDLL